jgi:hypothetical protein
MKKIGIYIVLLAAMPLLTIVGCKKDAKNASNVQFKLTDAPANFDALNIDVQGVMVHTQGGGWVTLQSSLGVINILNYVNGNSTLIAQGSFQAGTIDQVKLLLGANNNIVVNGVTHSFQTGGALQSAINLNSQLQAGGSYVWTIDFDAAQSVTTTGTGTFQLTPVLRLIVDSASAMANGSGGINVGGSGSGTATGGINAGGTGTGSATGGINVGGSGSGGVNAGGSTGGSGTVVVGGSASGSLSGSISPAGIASVCITGPNGNSVCTMTDLSGNFSIQAVGSGSYSVTITPTLPLLSAQTVTNVSVSAGHNTSLGVITL